MRPQFLRGSGGVLYRFSTMTSTAIKEYESVKVCHLDLLKTSYDEWKVDFHNLIGASTPSLYYLLSSPDGLLHNRPSTFVDVDAPTEAEKEALRWVKFPNSAATVTPYFRTFSQISHALSIPTPKTHRIWSWGAPPCPNPMSFWCRN